MIINHNHFIPVKFVCAVLLKKIIFESFLAHIFCWSMNLWGCSSIEGIHNLMCCASIDATFGGDGPTPPNPQLLLRTSFLGKTTPGFWSVLRIRTWHLAERLDKKVDLPIGQDHVLPFGQCWGSGSSPRAQINPTHFSNDFAPSVLCARDNNLLLVTVKFWCWEEQVESV